MGHSDIINVNEWALCSALQWPLLWQYFENRLPYAAAVAIAAAATTAVMLCIWASTPVVQ